MYEATHGENARGVPCAEAALRLNPCDPSRGSMLAALGFAQFAIRDYASAVASADAVARASPDNAVARVLAAISRVWVGDLERAAAEYRHLPRIAPALTASRLAVDEPGQRYTRADLSVGRGRTGSRQRGRHAALSALPFPGGFARSFGSA